MQRLSERTHRKRLSPGQLLFEKEEPGDGLYGILSGTIAFTMDSQRGKEFILNVLGTGECFGEIALLDGKGRTATAVAREACDLLFISRREFLDFFSQRPESLMHIVELLCSRLRRSTEYIADAAFLDLSTRLAKQLLALMVGVAVPATIKVSQAELAAMLGVSREQVSRQLAIWSGQGILDQRRGRIVISDCRALERLIAGHR